MGQSRAAGCRQSRSELSVPDGDELLFALSEDSEDEGGVLVDTTSREARGVVAFEREKATAEVFEGDLDYSVPEPSKHGDRTVVMGTEENIGGRVSKGGGPPFHALSRPWKDFRS